MPKLLPVKHIPQIIDVGCLAACAQMVLQYLGVDISQTGLNHLFDLTPLGVPLSRMERLEKFDIQVTIHRQGDLDDLLTALNDNHPTILFVRTGELPYWGEDVQHALVLVGYEGEQVFLNDPAFPNAPQKVLMTELMLAWDEFDSPYALLKKF